MKLLLCFGTRPEAIKMIPICHELDKKKIPYITCVTAQHREMLDQVLNFFEIVPDYDLDLMRPNQSLNSLSSSMLLEIEGVLNKENPTMVLVQGDTTTAFITALAAFNEGYKVAHIEAGLRTFDKKNPFPEEVNRQLLSRIADLHFAPTKSARLNLLSEKIPQNLIFVTGNTVVDALIWARNKINTVLPETEEIRSLKEKLDLQKKIILVTGHRRENIGPALKNICEALLEIARNENIEIIYPVHLNPQVSGMVYNLLTGVKNIHLVPPVSYPGILWLMEHSSLIISDSGGIQEEAPSFATEVLVTRKSTERIEGVESGFSFLVGTEKEAIVLEARKRLLNPPRFGEKKNPYGNGNAAKEIVNILINDYRDGAYLKT